MMRCKGIVAFASLALMAAPAAAQQPASKAGEAVKETKYCLQYSSDTGSRINRSECRTKKERSRLGVEVDGLRAK